jgi:hypothetical protein
MGSTTILTFRERALRGVNTMRPPSTFASSEVSRPEAKFAANRTGKNDLTFR